jgi:4-amino-4-deoxy-L-arabinose transferase-like glycosyltransferase
MPMPFFYITFLYCLFLVFAGLLIFHFRDIVAYIKTLPGQGIVLLAFLLFFAFMVRVFFIYHGVFYDEPIYLNVAQNIFYHHQSAGTLQGTNFLPEDLGFYNRPGGHPFLINCFYLFFGESERSALLMNPFLGSLSVGIFFLLIFWAFNNALVAFCAGMLASLFPIHLACSGSMASEIPSFFFVVLTLLALVLFFRSRKMGLAYLAFSAAACAFYIRPENLFYFLPLMAVPFFWSKEGCLSKKGAEDLAFFFVLLTVPLFSQLLAMRRIEAVVNQGQFWSVGLLREHFAGNAAYLLDGDQLPRCVMWLALLGTAYLYRTRKALCLIMLAWFAVFFIAYTGHPAGIFHISGRYFFMGIIPVCVLMAGGFQFFLAKCARPWGVVLCSVLLVLGAFDSFRALDGVYHRMLGSGTAQEQFFLERALRELPGDGYVVTIEPYVVVRWGKKAMHYDKFRQQGFVQDRVYLLKTVNWLENNFLKDEALLKRYYDFRIIAQAGIFSDSRTFIAELTKKAVVAH